MTWAYNGPWESYNYQVVEYYDNGIVSYNLGKQIVVKLTNTGSGKAVYLLLDFTNAEKTEIVVGRFSDGTEQKNTEKKSRPAEEAKRTPEGKESFFRTCKKTKGNSIAS